MDILLPNNITKGVYVLELENNNYYIGYSSNIPKRINKHFRGKGSMFTKLHKPIKVLEIIDGNLFTELQVTLRYVFIKGIDNVRGSIYSHTNPSKTKSLLFLNKSKYYIDTGYCSFKWIDKAVTSKL